MGGAVRVLTMWFPVLRCRQNKLEEALLISGQFSEALQALIDWLYKVEPQMAEDQPVHGDIDLVLNLIDNHKVRGDARQTHTQARTHTHTHTHAHTRTHAHTHACTHARTHTHKHVLRLHIHADTHTQIPMLFV